MRAQVLAGGLFILVLVAGYVYTQSDPLEAVVQSSDGDELVARSRRLQAEREQARRAHVEAALPDLPTTRPLVGPAGSDPWGYPLARPDKIGLRALLLEERFNELTTYVTEFQTEAEADFHKELWAIDAFDAFEIADPRLMPLLNKWMKHSPKSFAPYWARAMHRRALAWQVRGTKFAAKTDERRMHRFRTLIDEADRDLQRAIELRPAAIGPRLTMLLDARDTGAPRSEMKAIRDAAAAKCPKCYMPHRMWMYALQPRWGGSYEEMEAYAKQALRRIPDNPKLKVLAGMAAAERCQALSVAENLDGARRACDEAVELAPDNVFLTQRADIAVRQERNEDALADLDRVLARWPQNETALALRTRVLRRLERQEQAARDVLVLRRLDPSSTRYRGLANDSVVWIHAQGAHDFREKRYEQAERLLLLGLELDPGHSGIQNALGHVRAKLGVGPLQARVAASPDDFRAVRDLDHALAAENRYAEVIPLWDDYLSRHPDDGRAYLERGGAYHHLGKEKQARADIERGCELGSGEACALLERIAGR